MDGRKGYVLGHELAVRGIWHVDTLKFDVILFYKNETDRIHRVTTLQVMQDGKVQQEHQVATDHCARPVMIRQLNGVQLRAPIYAIASIPEGCGENQMVAHLFCWNSQEQRFEHFGNTQDGGDEFGYGVWSHQRVDGDTFTIVSISSGMQFATADPMNPVYKDSAFVQVKIQYEVRGTRYVLVDSMPEVSHRR